MSEYRSDFEMNYMTSPLDDIQDADLLKMLDDSSLIATLGIDPVPPQTYDCRSKLVSNASDYVGLVPPSPQLENLNSVLQNQTTYYTIDITEPQTTNIDNVVVNNIPHSNIDNVAKEPSAVAVDPIVLSPPTESHQLTTLTNVEAFQFDGTATPYILLNCPPEQDTPVGSVETECNSLPSVSVISTPTESVTPDTEPVDHAPAKPNRGKGVKRCNRKGPKKAEESDLNPKPKTPRRRREKKTKKYEIMQSFEDPEAEKKRVNAINAKKNRDKKKDMLNELQVKVVEVTKERDELVKEVEELKQRELSLRNRLMQKYGMNFPSL